MKNKNQPKKKITVSDLNRREMAVVRFLARANGKGAGLADITIGARRYKGLGGPARRSWWVRNAVRRPLAARLVARVDAGTYRITALGRRALGGAS